MACVLPTPPRRESLRTEIGRHFREAIREERCHHATSHTGDLFLPLSDKKERKEKGKGAKSMVFFAFGHAVGGFQRDEKYGRASAEGFMVGGFRLGGGEIENNISTPRGMKNDKIG
ncbi:hypothetical protein TNCT_494751 [Trichonephila clavata]|uniref:Uncharacterized protein n=1 Tax=Trichonephila clavata TaxID=2740835 RepID=A0A8X6LRG2_TRICU|nr:hypothetical protein TNCT_494751 [Trichonephila clavata]